MSATILRRGHHLPPCFSRHLLLYDTVQECKTSGIKFRKQIWGKSVSTSHSDSLRNYASIQAERRDQARRSILVCTERVNNDLLPYCQHAGGDIKNAFHFRNKLHPNKGQLGNYFLIEFKDQNAVSALIEATEFFHFKNNIASIPVKTRMLYYHGQHLNFQRQKKPVPAIVSTTLSDESKKFATGAIPSLQKAKSISQQMDIYHKNTRLTDVGSRLCYLQCSLLEDLLYSMFPHIDIRPFGSCVNGFGQMNCDLDMYLELNSQVKYHRDDTLKFRTKKMPDNPRTLSKHILLFIADMLQMFVPGAGDVRRIIHASVPIIKFTANIINLECDLSMTNRSGLYMSELLWFYGELDYRVRPLVFAVRTWAREQRLTDKEFPSSTPSNFTWTMLVIFFLQHMKILPTLETLQKRAVMAEYKNIDGFECTFTTDLNKFHLVTKGTSVSMSDLLQQFFDFYATLDLDKNMLSLWTGSLKLKQDSINMTSSLHIENPFEPERNISKNVSHQSVQRLQSGCQQGLQVVEKANEPREKGKPWGLIQLFNQNDCTGGVINVKHLFNDTDHMEQVENTVPDSDTSSAQKGPKSKVSDELSQSTIDVRNENDGEHIETAVGKVHLK